MRSQLTFACSVLVVTCLCSTASSQQNPPAIKSLVEVYRHSDGMPRFPDFGFMLSPSEYHGRVFLLSQNYPPKQPKMDAGVKRILSIDFKKDWKKYILEVRDYIFAGNINHDGYQNDFFLEDNKVRPWYHVPWQHWGPTGREGFHGLTQEGPIALKLLAPEQTSTSHAYAVGFYNDLGGYTFGRVWANANRPNIRYMASNGFPVGTVVGKVLFTTLDETQVPYLKSPLVWNAYTYVTDVPGLTADAATARVVSKVRLIQMDIMVRDSRADETGGWVFGTFAYNGNVNAKDRWYNLVPVGLMWGNNHEVTTNLSNPRPTQTKTNPKLTQTVINKSKTLPVMHLGWGFRLNGPVDNPNSSCMSCHSTAEYPTVSAILPFLNKPPVNPPQKQGASASRAWMRWFRNVPCATPFDPGQAVSMDYSLQLAKSIQNFVEFKSQEVKGLYGVEYWGKGYKVRRNVQQAPQ